MILPCFFVPWSLLQGGRLVQLSLLAPASKAPLWEEGICRFEHRPSEEDLDRTLISFFLWWIFKPLRISPWRPCFSKTHICSQGKSYFPKSRSEWKEGGLKICSSLIIQKSKSGKRKNLSCPLCLLISHWLVSTDAALPYSEFLLLGKGCTAA